MKNDIFGYLNALAVLGMTTRIEIVTTIGKGKLANKSEPEIANDIDKIVNVYNEKAKQLAKDYEV